MTSATTIALIALGFFAAFLFIARRVLCLALKLALVGALVGVLFVAAGAGWWRGWFGSRSEPKPLRPAPQSNQRPNSNRRPSQR